MRKGNLLVLALGASMLAACATEPSARTYTRSQMLRSYDVAHGEVVDVRVVKVEGNPGILGTWAGASVGRAVGRRSAGRGSRRVLAGAVGGVAGAVAGRAVARKLSEGEALEITVDLDGADTIVVVQGEDVAVEPGDRVRVLRGRDGSARVTPE